jgi:pimeloyl-ACP methyl ester carboxylesterase
MGFVHGNAVNDLAVAQCPIAVIGASRSGFVTERRIYELAPHLPKGSPLVVIPDAAHHIMADQPLALVAAIRTQLANWG